LLADSAGRRAASKTIKNNILARNVSMVGGRLCGEISQIETILEAEDDA
jgi:hypothetical protein